MKFFRALLFVGGIYFLLVSIAHFFSLKLPGLFIYFNVPSTAYQDRIISLLTFGWSVFFFSGAGAIIGLCLINMLTDFNSFSTDINTSIFWLETALLFLYWLSLVFFYRKSGP